MFCRRFATVGKETTSSTQPQSTAVIEDLAAPQSVQKRKKKLRALLGDEDEAEKDQPELNV